MSEVGIKAKEVKLVPVSELQPNPRNRNKHSDAQIERLAEIIRYQGFRAPIIVSNLSGLVVAGHGRLMAAQKLGLSQVPVLFQDFDNEEQEYAAGISENSIASWAELDLSGINMDIPELGPDFDIDMLGLKDFVLEPAEKLDPQCDEDEVPELQAESKVVLGDVFTLGRHRLMCGDSTSIDAVERLMNGEKADMVFTDPPYNTGMKPKCDSFTDEEWQALLSGMCASYWAATKDSAALYICLDWRRSHELVPHINGMFKFSNLIVWDKMIHGLGSDYKYTHEFIHVCKKGDPELKTNTGDQDYKDVWHIQRVIGRDDEHATKKPIEIVERAVRHASKDGQMVLDLFGGSGSTLIACEKTNRTCYMMELDPKYCAVILDRWSKYTGLDPIREDGAKWSEIKASV